jgi:hypothetical protein
MLYADMSRHTVIARCCVSVHAVSLCLFSPAGFCCCYSRCTFTGLTAATQPQGGACCLLLVSS